MLLNQYYNKQPLEDKHILPIVAGALVAGAASLIGGAISAGVASKNTSDINKANKEMNADQLAWSKEQQYTTWQREDSAWQRGVSDAEAAGLSPLAVTQGSTSGSLVGNPSAIPMQASNAGAMFGDAVASAGNHLSDAIYQQEQLKMQEKSLKQQDDQFKVTTNQKDEFHKDDLKRDYDNMQNSVDMLEIQISATADENEKKRFSDAKLQAERLAEQSREFEIMEDNKASMKEKELAQQRQIEYQKAITDRIKQVTNGKGSFKNYNDYSEYQAAMANYQRELDNFIAMKIGNTSESMGTAQNASTSAGANVSGIGASANSSIGGSNNYGYNKSQYNDALLKEFYETHEFPVYIGDISLSDFKGY